LGEFINDSIGDGAASVFSKQLITKLKNVITVGVSNDLVDIEID
jgi:hypothetical protein